MTSLLMRVVSLEGPPREMVLEGRRATRLGVTVPSVGRWRAVAVQVANVLHGGSFSAVAVFWVPGSHSFCRGHPAAFGEEGRHVPTTSSGACSSSMTVHMWWQGLQLPRKYGMSFVAFYCPCGCLDLCIFIVAFLNASQPCYRDTHRCLRLCHASIALTQCCFSPLRFPGASVQEVSCSGAARAGRCPGSAFLDPETTSCCPKAAQSLAVLPLNSLADYLSACLQWEIAIIGIGCFCRDRGLSPLP